MDGKSCTGMQTGTGHPPVPPQGKFQTVSARFDLFRLVSLFWPEYFLALGFYFFFLCFESTGPNLWVKFFLCFEISPPLDFSLRQSTSNSCLQLQAVEDITATSSFKPLPVCPLFLPPPAVHCFWEINRYGYLILVCVCVFICKFGFWFD